MSDKLNETFQKHLKLLHDHLNINEGESDADYLKKLVVKYAEVYHKVASMSKMKPFFRRGSTHFQLVNLADQLKELKTEIISLKGQEYFMQVQKIADVTNSNIFDDNNFADKAKQAGLI